MKRPRNIQPNRPAPDGYPYRLPQPAGAITYQLNGAQVGRGNILNLEGSGITFVASGDKGTYILNGGGGGGVTSLNTLAGALTLAAGSNITITPSGGNTLTIDASAISPITIENGNSLFSTGLAGLWNSTADLSIIFGVNAGDNADAATSLIALGELAGASDNAVPYIPNYATMIGNRSGYNAHSAIDATFIGHLAGAYAEEAAYSFFAGAQAGISATYAGNSFFFGQTAGHNATNAAYSTFMGLNAGYDAAGAGFSNFIGNLSGFQALTANNATFIGSQAGRADGVDNAGIIIYTGASGLFKNVAVITSSSGGRAYVITDNGTGTLRIMDSTGTFNNGDIITEFPSGTTATVSNYTPSTSSILIGDHTSTGGGKNSVAIGAFASNAGFDNSIVIGVNGANTMSNQYAWGDDIINWRFAGDNYILPTVSPSGLGQFLAVGASNQLSWEVPGANTSSSISVLAATVAVLPFTPTYNNGAAGVGATLTATAFGALVVDGVTIPLNEKVLVQNQAAQEENGPYELTTLGTGGVNYVLTRLTNADAPSDFTDMVVIPAQGTQSATPFGQQNVVTTIGTDPIVFASLSSIYVRQQTSGTQTANQIPVYTGTALTITKGTADFTFDPATKVFTAGDLAGNNFVLDGLNVTGFTFNGTTLFNFQNLNFKSAIQANSSSFQVFLGDVNLAANQTRLLIDDNAQKITHITLHHNFNLVDYANNAAAVGGGLAVGDLYYTSSGGDGLVKIVI